MKTISLRKFRDSISAQTEPVVIMRRDPDGTMHVLGTWTPNAMASTVGLRFVSVSAPVDTDQDGGAA